MCQRGPTQTPFTSVSSLFLPLWIGPILPFVTMAVCRRKPPHALLVPYPLQGHIIPAVHLATKLASRGFTITFVYTEAIHHQTSRAASGVDRDIFAAARAWGLDVRCELVNDGLPVAFDRSLNHDRFMGSLLHVLPAHVEELMRNLSLHADPPITCLIADTFFVWPSTLAKKFGLPYVSFWTEPALVFTLYYHLDLLIKHGHFASHGIQCTPILGLSFSRLL